MRIPKYLQKKLDEDNSLSGCVRSSIAEFEPWIKLNSLPFFPEYTDHGLAHIEGVLETANGLMSESSRELFTSGDSATLILAVLLHDVAMHLSEDSFLYLVQPKSYSQIINGFDDKSWSLLWEEFISEAKHFDGRKLAAIFGDTSPILSLPKDAKDFTKRDCLLIGEFLRRHHPRLAHEIALYGVPTSQTDKLRLKEVPPYLADLAGLVARSHGLPLRSCFNYLEKNYYSLRDFKGIHVIFHMSLVRVADYLQIEDDRAPQQALKIKKLCSPISQGEWKSHLAIRDVRFASDDPEAIFVDAQPSDVKTYLRIKKLLAGLQTELDASWAALGEVYGRFENERLDKLGLKLRRVKSNLDNESEFAKRVSYVPVTAKFQAAGADLLKLLIRPLYGNRPEIGIRELLQNSVDAVRELKKYKNSKELNGEPIVQDSDIIIALSSSADGSRWFSIYDRGIGMTTQVILDYFLTAGASYRNSEEWQKQFDSADGKSIVLRSGRFGIGALASFLLGNEITVLTRHVNVPENEGIKFTATLDSEVVELRKVSTPVGTTISILISEETYQNLCTASYDSFDNASWDWYSLRDPCVSRLVEGRNLKQKFNIPLSNDELPSMWHRIIHKDFQDIQWTYTEAPSLIHNGIIILRAGSKEIPGFGEPPKDRFSPAWDVSSMYFNKGQFPRDKFMREKYFANYAYVFHLPNISVFDADGSLPLNLERTGLTQANYPFDSELLEDVVKDFLAFVLINAPNQLQFIHDVDYLAVLPEYPGVKIGAYSSLFGPMWFYTNDGISITDGWNLRASNCNCILRIYSIKDNTENQPLAPLKPLPYPSPREGQAVIREVSYPDINQHIVGILDFDFDVDTFRGLALSGRRLLVSRIVVESENFQKISDGAAGEEEWSSEKWILWKLGKCPKETGDVPALVRQVESLLRSQLNLAFIEEVYLGEIESDDTMSMVASAWVSILGEPIIPYDLKERQQKFAHSYKTLQPYIDSFNSCNTKKG